MLSKQGQRWPVFLQIQGSSGWADPSPLSRLCLIAFYFLNSCVGLWDPSPQNPQHRLQQSRHWCLGGKGRQNAVLIFCPFLSPLVTAKDQTNNWEEEKGKDQSLSLWSTGPGIGTKLVRSLKASSHIHSLTESSSQMSLSPSSRGDNWGSEQ